MSLILPLLLATPLIAVASHLGWTAQLITLLVTFVMFGSGRLANSLLGIRDPFLGFVTGFVLLGHALLIGDFMIPGVHWQIVLALGLVGLLGFRSSGWSPWPSTTSLGMLAAAFTFVWCADTAPRVNQFYATGKLPFWLDVFIHAGTIAQFGEAKAIGRGMILMADMPRPLYHYVSYTLPALYVKLAGTSPLDTTLLTWLPFGILVMACGVIALGHALGGPQLATASLAALALIPDPSRLALGDGFLSFPWLLETAPGTPYSLGVACAALAALVLWVRNQSPGTLVLAWGLTIGCGLVRANTFLWLAPVVALGTIAGSNLLNIRMKLALVAVGLFSCGIFLVLLSWQDLRTNPVRFLFSYVQTALLNRGPTYVDGLYPALLARLPAPVAGTIGLGLIFFGTLGPWFLALPIFAWLAHRGGRLSAADSLPFLLWIVAAIEMLLAPVARNGSIAEYRHRGGPLLVIVTLIWTVYLFRLVLSPAMKRLPCRRPRCTMFALATLSLSVLGVTIGTLKRPHMNLAAQYYGTRVVPELISLARVLARTTERRPRFAVADQSVNARVTDDAAHLVALSSIPAYISCPDFLFTFGGRVSKEARRRMQVLADLAKAPTITVLKENMRDAGITYYVVTRPQDVPFDPERRHAISHAGSFAIYAEAPK